MTELSMLNSCSIPVDTNNCEKLKIKCSDCPHKDKCDGSWILSHWAANDTAAGGNLSPSLPAVIKDNIRKGLIKTYGDNKDNFINYNASIKNGYITVYDIFVAPEARGNHIAKNLIIELSELYQADVFAKCIKDSDAEKFWNHIAEQIQPTMNENPNDMYEHRISKQNRPSKLVSWYVYRYNKGVQKLNLW